MWAYAAPVPPRDPDEVARVRAPCHTPLARPVPDYPLEPGGPRRRPGRIGGPRGTGRTFAYWFPLYAFVRRKGHGPRAEDLAQGLFAELIDRGDLAAVDRSKGRFRAFLRRLRRLPGQRPRPGPALKRGGGVTFIPIDQLDAEARYARQPAHDLTPERLFERRVGP